MRSNECIPGQICISPFRSDHHFTFNDCHIHCIRAGAKKNKTKNQYSRAGAPGRSSKPLILSKYFAFIKFGKGKQAEEKKNGHSRHNITSMLIDGKAQNLKAKITGT